MNCMDVGVKSITQHSLLLVMDDSEISILDSIRFFEINLDFELREIFTAYKGLN